MGMYTEFHFNAGLREGTPQNVIDILRFMLHEKEQQPSLPNHPLFETERWTYMLQSDSAYFPADTHSTLRKDDDDEYYLCIRCNLKNYNHEIEKFIDWIRPYLAHEQDDFLGFYRYEETEDPTLVYMT